MLQMDVSFINCGMNGINMEAFESKKFIEAFIANIRQPLLVLDKNLHILTANTAFQNVFGLNETQTIGKLIYSLGGDTWNIPSLRKMLEEIFPQGKNVVDFEIKHHFTNRGNRILLLNADDLNFGQESENFILLSIEDITEAKKADEANAMLAAIVASSEDAIISKTLKGIVTTWNKSAEKLFGYTADEMIGQPILKIIPEGRIDEEPEIIRKITEGETIAHFETQRMGKGGKLIDISLTISPIKDSSGNIIGASKIARDITATIQDRKRIEESEKRFHNLIYSSPSGIALLDGEDLVITTANETIIKLWGKGKKVIGKKFFEALPELVDQGYCEILASVYKTGVPYNAIETPVRIVKKGVSKLKYYNFILYPQYTLNNEIDGIGIIASDVTSQALINKNIKENEERFRSLTQTLPQLVWVTNAKGESEFASSRWEEYTGIKPDGERSWKLIAHPEDLANHTEAWMQSLSTAQVYKSEVRLRSKAGEYRWHSVLAEPVLDAEKNIVKWVGAFTDIHDQKVKEEKKDEFMGIASHEMKTPLTTAKAYLQMLEVNLKDTQTEAKLFALKASQSIDRLHELISELLDVSKIQVGKLNYNMSTFDFNEMIKSTVENMRLTSPSSSIVLTGSVHDPVIGDEDRLQQVVINLLSNAIKYSPDSVSVSITIGQKNDTITVAVKDTGIGIPEENLNKIFEKYHRVEEHAVRFQGMGVGLFISYEIIERHNGTLWVESELGKGSTFYFTLPVKRSNSEVRNSH